MSWDKLSTRTEAIEKKLVGLTRISKHERCMYKVHEQLRDGKEKAYKPVLLAIGPYNDQDKVGQGFMKEHKLRYLQQMLKRTGGSVETYIMALRKLEKRARKCYIERISQTRDEFVEMMLLDGCFIIELLRKYELYQNTSSEDDPIISNDQQFPKHDAQDLIDEGDPIISNDQQFPEHDVQDLIDEGDPIISTEQSPGYEALDLIDEDEPIIDTDKQSPEYDAQDSIDEGDPIISSEQHPESKAQDPTDEDDPIFQMAWVLPRIVRDLLLFENQLPLFILAALFGLSESKEALLHKGFGNLGEHIVDIDEEKDGISVESSTSTAQILGPTRLNDLALGFFSGSLPFQWNVDSSSCTSTEKIKHLLRLAHEALTPSLPLLVCQRLKVGFRFKNAEFEHLLGLIHAAISISILDTKIDQARELNEVGVKLKNAETFKHQFGLIRKGVIPLLPKMENMRTEISYASEFQKLGFQVNTVEIEDWESIPYGLELQEAGVEFNMAMKFKDDVYEIDRWMTIPYGTELQESGIEFNKAKKFKDLHDRNKNEERKSKPCETGMQMDGVELKTVEKLKRLLCLNKIENWKSIPYGKELQDAGVEFNKAKKFKHLHALTEIQDWNIHGAAELIEAGIKFKKAEKCDVVSIKFKNGIMEISPLVIEDQTETYLRNLVAYEQYCDEDDGLNYVTNYVCFMDSIISTPKDVELLRRSGIIHNYLGDDEVISTMVNKLCDNLNFSARDSIYARTSKEVNMHCRRHRNVWMAKLRRDYFNSPWALISFLAAILLLALAITQTIFSIIP